MKIKILHCITDLAARGAQRMLLRLIQNTDHDQFEIAVVSLVDNGPLKKEIEAAGAEVFELGMTQGVPSTKALLQLGRVIRNFQPDVLQGWMYHGNLAACLGKLVARRNTPVVWNMRRALYELSADKPLTRLVIKTAKLFSRTVVAVIHNSQISVPHHVQLGFASGKNLVIGNGFPIAALAPPKRDFLRSELNISEKQLLVGTAGCFDRQKDYRNFMLAAAGALATHPNTAFVAAGAGVNSQNEELKKFILEASSAFQVDLQNNLYLLDERRDIDQVLASLDVFVLASENEGFPNVVGEAMNAGVPCVVTDVGACRELVSGVGTVVERKNHAALSNALCEMLALPKEKRFALGAASQQRISQHYSVETITRRYEQLYREICNASFPVPGSNWNLE